MNDPRIDAIIQKLDDHEKRERERYEAQEKLINARMEPINQLLKDHHKTLYGDGSEANQGLRMDVDRIKQRNVLVNFILGALCIPIIAEWGKKLWDTVVK